MNNLHEPMNLWESFKQGQPEAFQYFFMLHNSRVYYYLLRQIRDRNQAREITKHAFIVLFHHKSQIVDADHLLRRLYLNAKVGYILRLKGKPSVLDLEEEVANYSCKEASIMDDPDVAKNETLLVLQEVMKKLSPIERAVAELYFILGFSIGATANHLRLHELTIKAIISEIMKYPL